MKTNIMKTMALVMGVIAEIVVAGNLVNAFAEQTVDINQGFYISLMNDYYADVEQQIKEGIKIFYEQQKLEALEQSANIVEEMKQQFPMPFP